MAIGWRIWVCAGVVAGVLGSANMGIAAAAQVHGCTATSASFFSADQTISCSWVDNCPATSCDDGYSVSGSFVANTGTYALAYLEFPFDNMFHGCKAVTGSTPIFSGGLSAPEAGSCSVSQGSSNLESYGRGTWTMQCIMTSRGNTLGPDLMVQAKVTCSDDWAKYS
jgi:hypothetical protein